MALNIIFYLTLISIPLGIILRVYDYPGDATFLLGLIGITIYLIIRLIKSISKRPRNRVKISLLVLSILMSITLFSRYLYYVFWDYPTLIITPLFVLTALYFLKDNLKRNYKLSALLILYLLLTIPLFAFQFLNSPRKFIPQEWYNRYDVSERHTITLPYTFVNDEARELCNKALGLRDQNEFSEAIIIFERALKIEPKNPRLLFELSKCYARDNDLEKAIKLLDEAIQIDSLNSSFYNNRGLLFYKRKKNDEAIYNYKQAIGLDSSEYVFHVNLALAYYYKKNYASTCLSIEEAQKLGLSINQYPFLRKINTRHCLKIKSQ